MRNFMSENQPIFPDSGYQNQNQRRARREPPQPQGQPKQRRKPIDPPDPIPDETGNTTPTKNKI